MVKDYFSKTEVTYERGQTYTYQAYSGHGATTPEGKTSGMTHTVDHNWAHDFSEMTGVLLKAGLVIEGISE